MKGIMNTVYMSGSILWGRARSSFRTYLHAQYVLFSPVAFLIDAGANESSFRRAMRRNIRRKLRGAHTAIPDSSHSGRLPNMMEK